MSECAKVALDATTGFESLSDLGAQITIFNNQALASLGGFTAITAANAYGNGALGNVSGLTSLATVGGFLDIGNNSKLDKPDGKTVLVLGGRERT